MHFVDLGLSVKWADANLEATAPEETGGYYAFGETATKDDYRMETYKWAELDDDTKDYEYTKYCSLDRKLELDTEDDAATAILGAKYRLPSEAEMQELIDNCTWTWSTLNGVKGYKVESRVEGYEGRYIFLPANGLKEGSDAAVTGYEGYYLTSSLYETGPYRLAFSPQGISLGVTSTRYNGFSLRPVTEKPSPVEPELKVFTSAFNVHEFYCKESVKHKKVFIEASTTQFNKDKGYNPYMICFDKTGKALWNWTPLSQRNTAKYANWTMYDVSSDGGVIDCFNAITGIDDRYEEPIHNPFVAKLNANGQSVWGSSPYFDVPLHEFTGAFTSYGPIGSFTVCDNNGGAWVAAWNNPADQDVVDKKVCSEMVFVHFDKDGNKISPEITKNNASGTQGQQGIVTRAQMYTDESNNLFALVLYETVGGTSYGYYDLLMISADGQNVSQKNLMPARYILGDIRANITKDGKGGAYVTMVAVNETDTMNHLWLYHITSAGEIDAKDIDLTPEYCTSGISVGSAIDPTTGNIAIITMDTNPPGDRNGKKFLYFIAVNSKGEKIVSDNGKPLVLRKSDEKNNLNNNDFKVIYRPETGKIFVSYIYEGYMAMPQMKSIQVGFDGTVSEDVTLFNIDRHYYNNIDPQSQVYDFIDGNLLYFFRGNSTYSETTDLYGYILKQ